MFAPEAVRVLHELRVATRGRAITAPDGWIDQTLLQFPDDFGEALRPLLTCAREIVLRDSDEASRRTLTEPLQNGLRERETTRVRTILARRPTAGERTSPALIQHTSDGLTIALAHPIPALEQRATVRVQTAFHAEVASTGARMIDALSPLMEKRWTALGHTRPPHSVWHCDPPTWCHGWQALAIEVVPNPSGFLEAMHTATHGAGRVFVALPEHGDSQWEMEVMPAWVMPSGWSYLRGDRTQGTCLPTLPNGAPMPPQRVHVPDAEIFALTASRTFVSSLRDAIWLRTRPDCRALQ